MSDYKQFKIKRLDPISPTFCAAKWLTSDFYLFNGTTSSCHLPTPDKIDLNLVEQNINYFNNTKEKIEQRRQMLNGHQPNKCSNCWQVENNSVDAISERVLYSQKFSNEDFNKLDLNTDQKPKHISVAFDTLCNFTCSYCDASQSTSWRTDLLVNGPYKGIYNDDRKTYQRIGKTELISDYDKILDKFTEYVIDSLPHLTGISCLGGEPLISPNFWNFLERISKKDVSNISLGLHTNLSYKDNIKKLLQYKTKFKNVEIVASIDNIGDSAEFLRKGLNWKEFEENIIFLLEKKEVKLQLASTLSGISLDKIINFLDWYGNLAQKYPHISLMMFRLRHPNFQSMQVLPVALKIKYKTELTNWIEKNSNLISSDLIEQIKNVIITLDTNIDIYENIDINLLQQDAKVFYKEFAKRHNFNLDLIFSRELCDWINS